MSRYSGRAQNGRVFLACVALVLQGGIAYGVAEEGDEVGQEGQVWNLGTQQNGRTYPTGITAFNRSCKGKRHFLLTLEGGAEEFLKITGPSLLENITPGQTRTTDAVLDLTQVEPGVYNQGTIKVECTNCPPKCRQDHEVIRVHLTVAGESFQAPAEAPTTSYPTLDSPTYYLASYDPEIRVREDQTQAAVLLILTNLMSPREGIDPRSMAPPEDLEAMGLSESVYELDASGQETFSLESLRRQFDLPGEPFDELPERLVTEQREIAQRVASGPTNEDIVNLAAISSVHPDPLVRIAAAPVLLEFTDGVEEALDELRNGVRSEDSRLSLLAATLLSRFRPRDAALSGLSGVVQDDPGRDEEPETTIVIHGTFAKDETWWRDGSPFFEYLEHAASVDDLFVGDDPFTWSGEWSHEVRLQAAADLAQWAQQHREECLNVVGHSHGGNIALEASNNMQLGRMILLSTPAHPDLYSPGNYASVFSLRVRMDLVVLADGGGNVFPAWSNLEEQYFGWFDHSSTHDRSRWQDQGVPGWLPSQACPD